MLSHVVQVLVQQPSKDIEPGFREQTLAVVLHLCDSLIRWTGRGESGKPPVTTVWKEEWILERFIESVQGAHEGGSQFAPFPKYHSTLAPTGIAPVYDGIDL